jgi:serine/threonine-protein kinase
VCADTIGKFAIRTRLGAGGLGETWLAEHVEIGSRVAIKLFAPAVGQLEAIHLAFAEARALSRIAHTGIAKIYDADFHCGHAYVISELVAGETLADRMRRGRFSSTQVVAAVHPIARALSTAAAAGVLHHDLKPTNIVLANDRVVVVDFAASKLIASRPDLGTAAYMAPELLDGAGADGAADVYALGCLAFAMACERPPFSETQPRYPAPSVRSHAPDFGPVLDRLIASMLEVRPQDRPSLREVTKRFGMLANTAAPLDDTVE